MIPYFVNRKENYKTVRKNYKKINESTLTLYTITKIFITK